MASGGTRVSAVLRPIRNNDDTILLQNDVNKKIAEWEFMWQMQLNIDKCFILRVGRPKHKLLHVYTHQHLSETDSAKYLGVTITSDLQWNHSRPIGLAFYAETSEFPPRPLKHLPTNH